MAEAHESKGIPPAILLQAACEKETLSLSVDLEPIAVIMVTAVALEPEGGGMVERFIAPVLKTGDP